MSVRDCLLVCNAGSTTLKVKIFKLGDLSVQLDGMVERIGTTGSTLELQEFTSGRMIRRNFPAGLPQHAGAFRELASHLKHWLNRLRAAAHRIVHGGEGFRKPTWLTPAVVHELRQLATLAPLHNPVNLAVVAEVGNLFPSLPSIGVFDTAYYATLPAEAYLYALPYEYYQEQGVRRYGFHGISHQYLAQAAAGQLKRPLKQLKLITGHLGAGCSLTATKYGAAIETTMGFTPLGGLVMATRSGDLDPAVVTYLERTLHLSPGELDHILNSKSGLLGVFGYSADLRDVLTAAGYGVPGYQPPQKFTADDRRRGKLALAVFTASIVRHVGSLASAMGGVDAVVFSGAIGVRSPVVRQLVRHRLRWLRHVRYLVVPTDEELMMARLVRSAVLRFRPAPTPGAMPAAEPGRAIPATVPAGSPPPLA